MPSPTASASWPAMPGSAPRSRSPCIWPGRTMTTARLIRGSSPSGSARTGNPSRWPRAFPAPPSGKSANGTPTAACPPDGGTSSGPSPTAGTRSTPRTTSDPLLVARLVGTSHGHGRSGFPHTSTGLIPPTTAAHGTTGRELFDDGGWDELIEMTQLRYGVWGCAYLEAVLRAADCQVSGEGR